MDRQGEGEPNNKQRTQKTVHLIKKKRESGPGFTRVYERGGHQLEGSKKKSATKRKWDPGDPNAQFNGRPQKLGKKGKKLCNGMFNGGSRKKSKIGKQLKQRNHGTNVQLVGRKEGGSENTRREPFPLGFEKNPGNRK